MEMVRTSGAIAIYMVKNYDNMARARRRKDPKAVLETVGAMR